MDADQIDLLPEERRRSLRRAYLMRIATLAALLATVLIMAAAALLLPTYIYLASALEARTARLASVESALSSADQTALTRRLAMLEADVKEIASLAATEGASGVVREILAVPRQGVVLTGMSYAPSQGTLVVSGTAATRNDLRAYQLALAATPGFADADLPVASYAKDHDISFAVTVTLATSTAP